MEMNTTGGGRLKVSPAIAKEITMVREKEDSPREECLQRKIAIAIEEDSY